MGEVRRQASVLHLDLDAFFAAVEQRDKPSLRGKPVVVGGVGRRGVVSTASYEARVFGVGSAMPTWEARRRAPNAAYLSGRFPAYRIVSEQVFALARALSPLVEPLSLDEAFIDLAPTHEDLEVDDVTQVAEDFRAAVLRTTGLTVSVGAASSKLVAKIASDLRKPDALVIVAPGTEAEFLAIMPVRRLPGVGPATQDRLHQFGVHLVGELARMPESDVVRVLGKAHGTALHHYARGDDDRPVVPERDAKSVSAEETFPFDLTDRAELGGHVKDLAARVARRLASGGVSGRTVTIKVRRHDFTTLNRSRTTPHATSDARDIVAAATELLDAVDVADGVRLLGVGVSGLTEFAQQDLFGASADDEEPDVPEPALPEPALPGASSPAPYGPEPTVAGAVEWRPGQDVVHEEHGPGWVQGAGVGRVTVRFEGPHTGVGRLRTFAVEDPALSAAGPPPFEPEPEPRPFGFDP